MAKRKKLGMNKYQRKAHKRGEDRLRGDDVEYYLSLAYSANADDRLRRWITSVRVMFGKVLTKFGWHSTKVWLTQMCAFESGVAYVG